MAAPDQMDSSDSSTMPETLSSPHALALPVALAQLDASESGLPAAQARERLEKFGPNALPQTKPESAFHRLLRQFRDPMIYVLIAAAVFTAVLGEVVDTIVIAAVVLINALVGYFQEGKAADALAGIRKMLSLESAVLREGRWDNVPAEELVPGDIVRLKAGDKVPADLRLIQQQNLQIEESALTGESVPVTKALEPVAADAPIGDRANMAFSGTTVTAGAGLGLVTGTGSHTEIGHITTMLEGVEQVETPLTRTMAKFSSLLAVIAVILAVLMMIISAVLYQTEFADLLMSAIGFAVAAIPEGLPAVMAITLALGVQKMAGRNAITRRLNSVETLGSVTTICSDKTGTLTKNEMTVREVVTPDHRYRVTGTGYGPTGSITLIDADSAEPDAVVTAAVHQHRDLWRIAKVAAYANDADVEKQGDVWTLIGEPTDGGIRTFAMKTGVSYEGERIAAVPFDSDYKYMATLDAHSDRAGLVIHLKGAPDRLLDRCESECLPDGSTRPLGRAHWEAEIERLGASGMRVLAAAERSASPDTTGISIEDVDAGGFSFLGLYGIIDPPREEAIAAVATFHRAGVNVKMITGDHAATAAAIAREIGIPAEKTITGPEIEAASDERMREIVREYDVYARTSPEHKLRLVQALQANGEVVSMTGDGVNDAPSLKQADIGVAMGIKGTEATKDAADVVLADDNFATIGDAVKMGRTIYDNLRKTIVFMLPTNGAQGLVILVSMLLGMTLPITPLQVLWVNLITAVTLSLALSFEPSEPNVMDRKPRDPNTGILDAEAVIRIIYTSLFIGGATIGVFLLAQESGVDLAASRTIAVHTLVVGQIFYLFASRFSKVSSIRRELFSTNPISWLCVGLMLLLQLAFGYLPFMQSAFHTTTVPLDWWLIPLAVGVVIFLVVEVDKLIRRVAA
ncbi:cation-transporting P-type ATPase [Corynebacterium sp. A21]|uniref:cation-transporting P-type ATPase n=1 Tax=Corynebacterium sp. A21 TaxID=3457318 RepID=UPI003FCF0C6B